MDIERHRKARLRELVDHCCDRKIADFAKRIGRADSYVGRMLYPPEKAGSKPIGDKLMRVIEHEFGLARAWFDMPLGTRLPGATEIRYQVPATFGSPDCLRESDGAVYKLQQPEITWPFRNLSYSRIAQLKADMGLDAWQDAMDDIGKYLDIMLMKFEGEVATVKSRRAS